jgi:hypothetical protein
MREGEGDDHAGERKEDLAGYQECKSLTGIRATTGVESVIRKLKENVKSSGFK